MSEIILSQGVAQMRDQVQKAVVEIITKGLQEGEISEERAKSIAKMVLEKLPENITFDEFITVLPTLDDDYPEIADVIVPIMEQYEKKMKGDNDIKITELIKHGKIDEALNLTNQAIEKERNLT
jgi:uncharacterized membrane-anchored protein YjiN (DUF445 family)